MDDRLETGGSHNAGSSETTDRADAADVLAGPGYAGRTQRTEAASARADQPDPSVGAEVGDPAVDSGVRSGHDGGSAGDPLGRNLGHWDHEAYPAVVRPLSRGWEKDQQRLFAHFEAVLEDAKRANPEARKDWKIDWEWIQEEVGRSTYFVAEAIDGRFLGIVGYELARTAWGPVTYINTIYITPRARYKAGVFDMLLAEVEKVAKGLGLKWVTASFIYRKAAERVAKKMGYSTIGVNILKEV